MSGQAIAHICLTMLVMLFMYTIWFVVCMHRTNKAMEKINELIMEIAADTSIDRRRIAWLFDEFYQIEYREYNSKLLFFRSPTVLFGPALQTLMMQGLTSACRPNERLFLHDERWWDIYEKIYRGDLETHSRRWTRLVMARDNVGMEEAMIRLHIRVDDWLDPDRENIKKAMADACAEYDEAMAAQEIMDA